MHDDRPDNTDRLFERYELENPPPRFTERVLARARVAERIQRISALATLAFLCLLGAFAFALGRGLTLSGALDTVRLLLDNLDVAPEFAGDFAAALLESLPWAEIGALAVGIAGVWFALTWLPRLLAARQSRTG